MFCLPLRVQGDFLRHNSDHEHLPGGYCGRGIRLCRGGIRGRHQSQSLHAARKEGTGTVLVNSKKLKGLRQIKQFFETLLSIGQIRFGN